MKLDKMNRAEEHNISHLHKMISYNSLMTTCGGQNLPASRPTLLTTLLVSSNQLNTGVELVLMLGGLSAHGETCSGEQRRLQQL